jgi:hypothetical protein
MILKRRGFQGWKFFRGLAIVLSVSLIALYLLYTALTDAVIKHPIPVPTVDERIFESTYENDTFLVSSPNCQIPNLDPFHESIRKFVTLGEPIVCSTKSPLTYVTMASEGVRKYLLKVNTTAMADYAVEPENVSCCYSVINRVNDSAGKKYNRDSDNHYSVTKCTDFKTELVLNSEEEFILVRCFQANESGTNKDIYKNTHAVVPMKADVELKLNKTGSESSSKEEKRLSVLLLGFDSVSRLNLLRTMPKTVKYLRRSGWLEMSGYNKVGDNTLPNLAAVLTGLGMDQLRNQCWVSRHSNFDNCPFVWKEYSELGYVTAYAEDDPRGSTFNYHKTGFVIPPTDYYIRPFLLASEEKLPNKKRYYLSVCLGPTPTSEHIFRYTLDFATVFNTTPSFMMSWINNFSHSTNAIPEKTDERVFTFFQQLKETGAFNTTFIIFLSDHGMRWGNIRKTAIGWYEERLPFIHVWVPEWFKQKHPDIYNHLKTNSRRLTSPFDLHLTLREILRLSRQDNASLAVVKCPGCPKCCSLFSEVSEDRACEEAGITANWCTCNNYRTISTNGNEPKAIALQALSEINEKLKKAGKVSASCAELTLENVIDLKQKVSTDLQEYFIVMFDTIPGGARFEATVLRSNRTFQLQGDVSRINTYGNQTECVDDAALKLYCYCI